MEYNIDTNLIVNELTAQLSQSNLSATTYKVLSDQLSNENQALKEENDSLKQELGELKAELDKKSKKGKGK